MHGQNTKKEISSRHGPFDAVESIPREGTPIYGLDRYVAPNRV